MNQYQVPQGNEVDLGQLFWDVIKRWKMVFTITLIGAAIALGIALGSPQIYKPVIHISLPNDAHVEHFNQESVVKMEGRELFRRFYQALRSEVNFRLYLSEYMPSINEGERIDAKVAEDLSINSFISSLEVVMLEPYGGRDAYIEYPSLIELGFRSSDEAVAVKLLNEYVVYTNKSLLMDLKHQLFRITHQRLDQINTRISTLRKTAAFKREQKIKRLEAKRSLEISQLKNNKRALIDLASRNQKATLERVRESLVIAESLNIEDPHPQANLITDGGETNTSGSQSAPLYLMGVRYLKALQEILSKRKGDVIFLKEVNEIDSRIEAIINDPELTQLKNRASDDPYIDELPELMEEADDLKVKDPSFEGIMLYQISKPASITGEAIKPDRLSIAVFGVSLAAIVALFVAVFVEGNRRRKVKAHGNGSHSGVVLKIRGGS
ncbi:hypothetical protein BTA51_07625 [Hahella sp. CCB-MM4]|uniref:Wzz/FepE/Etk N-terminal domain-containing protein n=1 Tax=Hahella sp. (strain CCB-MM4) TaxID=1926491 RepID=UPI000B9AC915|nr:Wzz/FepE/Etk N-terminal domain-containing protein [Hahella sp. CCB-MM4]OZG73676.1 hypothetical protein BTA51_07625 [Hahella sp. CCB-MM4]